jgi:hypothetical protein
VSIYAPTYHQPSPFGRLKPTSPAITPTHEVAGYPSSSFKSPAYVSGYEISQASPQYSKSSTHYGASSPPPHLGHSFPQRSPLLSRSYTTIQAPSPTITSETPSESTARPFMSLAPAQPSPFTYVPSNLMQQASQFSQSLAARSAPPKPSTDSETISALRSAIDRAREGERFYVLMSRRMLLLDPRKSIDQVVRHTFVRNSGIPQELVDSVFPPPSQSVAERQLSTQKDLKDEESTVAMIRDAHYRLLDGLSSSLS